MNLFDKEAEQILLGSIMQNPAIFSDISLVIRPEDFYFEQHRQIYHVISEEIDAGGTPEPLIVYSSLKEKIPGDAAGTRAYIMEVADQAAAINPGRYAETVREYSLRRRLFSIFKDLGSDIQSTDTEISDVLGKAEKSFFEVSGRFASYNVQHLRELKDEYIEFINHIRESEGGITGTRVGIPSFDSLTGGLKGGQLIILAARPGGGKTTLALNLAAHVGLNEKSRKSGSNLGVLFFSLEMTKIELLMRLVCSYGLLESQKIMKGFFSQKTAQKLVNISKTLFESDMYIDDSTDLSNWHFKQRSRRWANKLQAEGKTPGLIVVDYLQLMTDSNVARESRQLEVASISRGLKLIAKELDVPVIALSQMNRSIEQRGKDPRPQLADLRESGSIEQDADMVLFLHRPEQFKHDLPETEKNKAELILAKHRAGPTQNFTLNFLKGQNRFVEADDSYDSDQ